MAGTCRLRSSHCQPAPEVGLRCTPADEQASTNEHVLIIVHDKSISAMRINQRNRGDSSARQHQLSRMQSELTVTVDSGQDNRENNKGPTS